MNGANGRFFREYREQRVRDCYEHRVRDCEQCAHGDRRVHDHGGDWVQIVDTLCSNKPNS